MDTRLSAQKDTWNMLLTQMLRSMFTHLQDHLRQNKISICSYNSEHENQDDAYPLSILLCPLSGEGGGGWRQ